MAYFYGLLNQFYNGKISFIGMAKYLSHSQLIKRVNQNVCWLIHTLIEQACYFHPSTGHCWNSSLKQFIFPSLSLFRPFNFCTV
jgi:hypothetical protein